MDTNLEKYRNYFTVNGKKYYTGTVLIIHKNENATFICYNVENNTYILKHEKGYMFSYSYEVLKRSFVAVTDKIDSTVHMPRLVTMSDSNIDGMMTGWLVYVSLMVLSIPFKDVIGLWVFITISFFQWRRNKIKKEGTRVEW